MSVAVLVIEDDRETARRIGAALRAVGGFEVTPAETVGDAVQHLLAHPVDCVLLDYRLPDSDGLEGLRVVRDHRPDVPVIMITAAGSEEVAVEAMKLGAADYVVKHGCYVDRVPSAIQEALGHQAIRSARGARPENATRPLGQGVRERYRGHGLVGESRTFDVALSLADRAAASAVTVLLQGETGTGKELFARAIHAEGTRARRPFVAINCAALPEPLLESELFGHVRGAFSGADRDRRGLFEEASGGTILLDEVDELSVAMQGKLLRALQEREVRALGASRSRAIDVRLMAATNRDLHRAVSQERFRLDLYHRLHVFPIRLPALRERGGDLRLLATHFLDTLSAKEGKAPLRFGAAVFAAFDRYAWPGNVRELANEVHRLVLFAERGSEIDASMLAAHVDGNGRPAVGERPLKDIVREVELATIRARLREHGYRRSVAAKSLGMTREGLWQKLRQLGFRPPRRDFEPVD